MGALGISVVISLPLLALFFVPCWVAAGAVLEVGNAFFTVLAFSFFRRVFVADITRVSDQAVWVAFLAGTDAALAMVEGECMRAVENRW